MELDQPYRRPTSQFINMVYTTRRLPPIMFYEPTCHLSLPPAPDPPTWSLPSLQTHPHSRNNISRSATGEPYHVTSSTNHKQALGHRRSPSPIPVAPGAPIIPPLSDLDVEEEDKELAGMDMGYVRLGGRPQYLPSPPPTPEPPKVENQDHDLDDPALSKMNEQLDSARQYIQAQAQMGARRPGPAVVQDPAENSARNVSPQKHHSLPRPPHHEGRPHCAPSQRDRHHHHHGHLHMHQRDTSHRHEQHSMAQPKQLHPRMQLKFVSGHGREHGKETKYFLN